MPQRHPVHPVVLIAPLLMFVLGACSVLTPAPATPSSSSAPPAEASPTAARPAAARPSTARNAAAATPAVTDANIAAIVVAANNADIAYAEQALAKSRDAEIRQFAQMTKRDHESINTVAGALVTRLKVTPVDNEVSFDLRDDSEVKRALFRELDGFSFDSAYIANEVTYHTNVLLAIDSVLVPSARNPELRALLVQVRPAVAAHRDHAEALAAKKTRRPARR